MGGDEVEVFSEGAMRGRGREGGREGGAKAGNGFVFTCE